MIRRKTVRRTVPFVMLILAILPHWVRAGDAPSSQAPLPIPLTLDQVMSQPLLEVPTLQIAQAALDANLARQQLLQSGTDLKINVFLEPRYIQPSALAQDMSKADSRATLELIKPVYDFGRQANAEAAAAARLSGQNFRYDLALNQYRLDLMASFFAVVLADLAYIRDNEAMSIAFVNLDRLRVKKELGQVSDIVVAEQEQTYQRTRLSYFSSQAQQQISRSRLAQAMNRPDELVAEIEGPKPLTADIPQPELAALRPQIMAANPLLKALRVEVEAAATEVAAARAERRPNVSAAAKAMEYERVLGNQNAWEVGLLLQIPLWQGERVSATIAAATARLTQARALVREAEIQLVHQARQLLQDLQLLRISIVDPSVKTIIHRV